MPPAAFAVCHHDAPHAHVRVCPHLDVEHRPGVSLVWTGVSAIAWQRLASLAGAPLEIAPAGTGEPAAPLAQAMRESLIDESTLDPAYWAAWAGPLAESSAEALQRESCRLFGVDWPLGAPSGADPDRIALWSGFAMHPRFDPPLARAPFPRSHHGVQVPCFGVWSSRDEPESVWQSRATQALVHFPRTTDAELVGLSDEEIDAAYNQFVVELRAAEPEVRIIVATLPAGSTLARTINRALSLLQEDDAHPRARFSADEGLFMPVIDIACAARSSELADRVLESPSLGRARLGPLDQVIRFRLDDGGAKAPSPSRSFGLMSPPRRFSCAMPFLVLVLAPRSKLPVFAAWVENAEVLAKAPASR
ncbi:hypothetical protein [Sorangium cellulosum]|uniref:hypothetical protein n=1 Tax=Sorangium cellulosum TaxID=56 RepID=UPI0003131DDA|nr:hypothetical protein [Sorangium cellulosum]